MVSRPIGDISAALAYQVKKEIAENFFGTRKILEEERCDLIGQRTEIIESWAERVQPLLRDLFRLLQEEEEGRSFLILIKREDLLPLFRPPGDIRERPQTPMACPPSFALTARGKYRKWILALYQAAFSEAEALKERTQTLQKKTDLFNEDLKTFNASFNLTEVLSLINTLEGRDDLKGILGENSDPQAISLLEEKLALKPLDLSSAGPPFPPLLPAIEDIRKPLSLLIDLTFQKFCPEIKKTMRGRDRASSLSPSFIGRPSRDTQDTEEAPPSDKPS
ncbi:MAG: hypothetical protein AB1585_21045 [Thermodesulfobacteriota bacterium]